MMKIYKVEFDPIYPVPCGLIIAAENEAQAREIAESALDGIAINEIKELDATTPGVLFFENGDY